MIKLVKIFLLIAVILTLASCELICKCGPVGTSVVKVFLADDDIPNVNIEVLSVYPGQKVVFEGLEDFSLRFDFDPQNPAKGSTKYESRNGKITIVISRDYTKILDQEQSGNQVEQNAIDVVKMQNSVNEIRIKYDVESKGKVRDPMMRIIKL